MSTATHIGAALIGVLLLGVFLKSAFRVAVINRQTADRVSHRIARLIHRAVVWQASKRRNYAGIQDVLSWELPLYIFLLIVTWFLLVQISFALVIWSFKIEQNPLQALIASGSALSTLGFLTPPSVLGQSFAILEGAIGLGIVVFFLTFIPGYQNSIESRQAKVAWLYARGHPELRNFTLVEWFQSCDGTGWNELWQGWEIWFRNIAETHAIAPILAFVPTVHRGQTWLAASAVVLDSASLFLSVLQTPALPSALVCHQTGVDALRLIAAELPPRPVMLEPSGSHRLERGEFDAACNRLAALGAQLRPDRDVCWTRFTEFRREYEASLTSLSATLLVIEHNHLLLPLMKGAVPRPGFNQIDCLKGATNGMDQ